MADLIIKPATGDGNKLILQDKAGGAVMTTADSGATLADGIALGTPASGTLTNATFPTGMVTKVFTFIDNSSGECSVTGGTSSIVACDPFSFSAISGRIYVISGSQSVTPRESNAGSYNVDERAQNALLYYGTTDRTFGASQTGDTRLMVHAQGRILIGSSTVQASSYHTFAYHGHFTAGSTATHYFYTAISVWDSNGVQAVANNSAFTPHTAFVLEVMP